MIKYILSLFNLYHWGKSTSTCKKCGDEVTWYAGDGGGCRTKCKCDGE